jgi:hypothetical protein
MLQIEQAATMQTVLESPRGYAAAANPLGSRMRLPCAVCR